MIADKPKAKPKHKKNKIKKLPYVNTYAWIY